MISAISAASALIVASAQQQPPVFRAAVEVTTVDVAVVDGQGKPIANLSPDDFTVRIDGESRRVVSAQWIPQTDASKGAPTAPPAPDGFTSNEGVFGGRLIVLAIDLPNIRFGGVNAIVKAADGFINKLEPSDRIAVVGLGPGAPATPFLSDFAKAKDAVASMNGTRPSLPPLAHSISVSEAVAIVHNDIGQMTLVKQRECSGAAGPGRGGARGREQCEMEVETESDALGHFVEQQARLSLDGLENVLDTLRNIEGAKTVVLVSEGFVVSNDDRLLAEDLGRKAAAARATVYALRLDEQLFDLTSNRRQVSAFQDRQLLGNGLESLVGVTRGEVFTVTGGGNAAFERIESELTGYYLLGVESDPRDRDGKPHPVKIDVKRSGALVRARREVVNAAAESRARSPQQAVAAALTSLLPLSGLPIRIATFPLQGPERNRVQMLIHAEIGKDYSIDRNVAIGYTILDANGRVVDNRLLTTRIGPTMNGVPSALQFTGGAALPAGEYTLKFVAAEGDRVGSVEHPLHATLLDVNGVKLSELMVGGPTQVRDLTAPTVGYTVNFGIVHGYVEAYGPSADAVTVKYEIAASEDSPALISNDAPGLAAGDDRMIFSRVIPVPQLPPGTYVLRARVVSAGQPLGTMIRHFELAPPPVLMASAAGAGGTPTATGTSDLFLPIDERALAQPFNVAEVLAPAVLGRYRARVAASTRAAFDNGVAALTAKDFVKAETSFKAAVQPDVDSGPALVYLAAVFAAAKHDEQAAAAWQTSMTDATESPEVYDWLVEALLRTHSLGEAQAALEDANRKWPADPRFTRPLALVYATFGKGVEATRLLQRYLEERVDDAEAARLGVEWIYQLHTMGALVHSRGDDLVLAREWAKRYGNGPQQPLVQQWLDFLDKENK